MQYDRLFRVSIVALAVIGLSGCADQSVEVATLEEPQFTPEEVRRAIENHRLKHESYEGPTAFVPGDGEPLPIPGGLAPGLHVWLPGPVEQGLQGLDVDPSTITNFQGLAAIGYFLGVATGSDGNDYDMLNDMRIYRGNFISEDGRHHRGTFAFI